MRSTSCLASVVLVSDAYRVLQVTGPERLDVLTQATGVDLDPRAFPTGRATRTAFAKVSGIIHRVDERPAFDLYVDASARRLCGQVAGGRRREARRLRADPAPHGSCGDEDLPLPPEFDQRHASRGRPFEKGAAWTLPRFGPETPSQCCHSMTRAVSPCDAILGVEAQIPASSPAGAGSHPGEAQRRTRAGRRSGKKGRAMNHENRGFAGYRQAKEPPPGPDEMLVRVGRTLPEESTCGASGTRWR